MNIKDLTKEEKARLLEELAAEERREREERAQREADYKRCLLYTSPSPRDRSVSRMPSSA